MLKNHSAIVSHNQPARRRRRARSTLLAVLRTAAVIVAAALLLAPLAAQAKELRWKLAAGDRLHLTFDQQIDSETTIGAKATTINMEMTLEMDWNVDEASDDQATIKQQFTRARLKISAPAQEVIEYDSASADPPAAAARGIEAAIRPLLGAEFVVTMTNRGEIRDAALSDEAAAALQAAVASPEIKQLFSPTELAKILRQAAVVLPQESVEQDDTWQTTSELPSPLGPLVQTTTFTLLGDETRDGAQVEKIGVDLKIDFADEETQRESKFKIVAQNQSGTIFFDAAAGRLVAADLTQTSTTKTTYRDVPINVHVNSRLQVRLAPIDESANETANDP